jgi:hypothetical protein
MSRKEQTIKLLNDLITCCARMSFHRHRNEIDKAVELGRERRIIMKKILELVNE